MGIKRWLKLFWAQHSDPILFWTIVFIAIIFITQTLNSIAKDSNENKESNKIEQENVITISKEEQKNNKELIEEFIKLCQNKEIEKAYELLSTKCKTDLYPNIEKFKEQYYNKIFNVKREIEIEIVDNQTYKIKFTEDILESGKIEGRESIIDYYKIDSEILEDKLYINNEKTIK